MQRLAQFFENASNVSFRRAKSPKENSPRQRESASDALASTAQLSRGKSSLLRIVYPPLMAYADGQPFTAGLRPSTTSGLLGFAHLLQANQQTAEENEGNAGRLGYVLHMKIEPVTHTFVGRERSRGIVNF